jgi:hypothetical protein
MSIKNKASVVRAWTQGNKARTKNRSLSTDGTYLMSYGKLIGLRLKSGYTIVGNYTAKAKGSYFSSQTTSTHVGLAAVYANALWHPLVFENSPAITEHIGDLPF